jgi:hypothetical protein
MTEKLRQEYEKLLDEFLAVQGDHEQITNYNTKKRKLNKLGNMSVKSRKR